MQKHRTKIRLVVVLGTVAALGLFASLAAAGAVAALGDGPLFDPNLAPPSTATGTLPGDTPAPFSVPFWPHKPGVLFGTSETYTDVREDGSYYDPEIGRRVYGRIFDNHFRDASKVSVSPSSRNGFDWGDFGIGAATMLGLMLLVTGLGVGARAARHRGGQLKIS